MIFNTFIKTVTNLQEWEVMKLFQFVKQFNNEIFNFQILHFSTSSQEISICRIVNGKVQA